MVKTTRPNWKWILTWVGIGLIYLMPILTVQAGSDMFLKVGLSGDTKGEAMDKDHKDEIDVLSWSWGATNSGTTHVGGGSGSGKTAFADLKIVKYIDLSSPQLYLSCANGKHYDEVKLTVRKAGDRPLDYVVITAKEVIISSVTSGGSGGEDRLTETITLNYAKITVVYRTLDSKGAQKEVTFTWDIAKNEKG